MPTRSREDPNTLKQLTLREFPSHHAQTLHECLDQLRVAAGDLATCKDALDELPETHAQM